MKNFFSINIAALDKISPVLAKKLKNIKENKKFEVFVGKDPIDINILDIEKKLQYMMSLLVGVLKN